MEEEAPLPGQSGGVAPKKGTIGYWYDGDRSLETGQWDVLFTCEEEQLEQALRNAVTEYVCTPEGIRVARQYRTFNWGDAIEHVPQEIWRRHGILEIGCLREPLPRIELEHDEDLFYGDEIYDHCDACANADREEIECEGCRQVLCRLHCDCPLEEN